MQASEEIRNPDADSLIGPGLIVDYLRPVAYTTPLLRARKTCDALESHAAGTIALLTKDQFCRTRPFGLEFDSSLVALYSTIMVGGGLPTRATEVLAIIEAHSL